MKHEAHGALVCSYNFVPNDSLVDDAICSGKVVQTVEVRKDPKIAR